MSKTIKHLNLIRATEDVSTDEYKKMTFVCRGCTMRNRAEIWQGYMSSIAWSWDREHDNSYLTLEEEPENNYDPNAVQVVCRGEFFGTMGYVGKEFTASVKEILANCAAYRLDVVDDNEIGNREVSLVITWKK